MIRFRGLLLLTTAAFVAAVAVFATGPSRPLPVAVPVASSTASVVRGAIHVHTTRSDGALSKREVARHAARSGLQFIVLTDHGTGVPPPDAPEYIDGVLCIDGIEVATNDGHYLAIGIATPPYPLGGDGEAVAEDVRRLGGFGIVAHPMSPRDELRWTDWDMPIDGIEWLNADSEWRDEGWLGLSRALIDYAWRPAGALARMLDRPVASLERWDALTARRRVVAIAAQDAHGGLGAETADQRGRRVHVPSYESSFSTFSTYAALERPFAGDAAGDAATLILALREGSVYSVVDAIASPAALDFRGTLGSVTVGAGQVLPAERGAARFSARASVPAGASIALLRNGRTVADAGGGVLDYDATEAGTYRVEIAVAGAPGRPPVPWLVSNPIYWFASPDEADVPAIPAPVPAVVSPARAESDPGSSASIQPAPSGSAMTFRLRGDARVSQFATMALDLREVPAEADAVIFKARALRPMRVLVQLRFAGDGHGRWGRSVYVDETLREVVLPMSRLRFLGSDDGPPTPDRPPAMPQLARATSLLFVVDLTNAVPGTEGTLVVSDAALARLR